MKAERAWRCGTDALCLDASRDALRPNDEAAAPTTALVSPALEPSLPDQISASQTDLIACDAECGNLIIVGNHYKLHSVAMLYKEAESDHPRPLKGHKDGIVGVAIRKDRA